MLFFEPRFLFFFAVFFVLYTSFNLRMKHWLILIASYYFYASWDWRFLSLIMISTATDFFAAQLCASDRYPDATRKRFLYVSMVMNLGFLGFFKYFNFFTDSAVALLNTMGFQGTPPLLNVILPAGISFYTFQTMSYVIDCYRREIKPEKDFVVFAAFVAYFPQLVAGPIERAADLIPRIKNPEPITVERIMVGLRLFGWGMFKKIFIADNLAPIVDSVFANPGNQTSLSLVVGAWAFAFQIYCDFSAYSDMARGLGKILGIDLNRNFHMPYFAGSIREFWKRWHITLSTWFRDYVYIPLGGNRDGKAKTVRNLVFTMGLSGLWHGAGWPFIIWGLGHGTIAAAEHTTAKWRITHYWQRTPRLFRAFITFNVVCALWILFRAPTMEIVGQYFGSFGKFPVFDFTQLRAATDVRSWALGIYNSVSMTDRQNLLHFAFFVSPLVFIEYFKWKANDELIDMHWSLPAKAIFYATLISLALLFGATDGKQFIYFQF